MSTRDTLRLALAKSLMQQGDAPASPLALFGNLARQAVGFQLQQKALDDIEARKQAAQTEALSLLRPQTVNAGILDEGFEPSEVVRQQNPSMANLISVIANRDLDPALRNLAGDLIRDRAEMDRAIQKQQFESGERQKDRIQQMDIAQLRAYEQQLDRESREAIAKGDRESAIEIAEIKQRTQNILLDRKMRTKKIEAIGEDGKLVFVSEEDINKSNGKIKPVPASKSVNPGNVIARIMLKEQEFGRDSLSDVEKKQYDDYQKKRQSALESLFAGIIAGQDDNPLGIPR